MIYGNVIKKIRKNMGISQKKLCEQLSVKQPYLSAIESGEKQPSREFLEKVCYVLDVPMYLIVFASTEQTDMSEAAWNTFIETESKINEILMQQALVSRTELNFN